MPSTPGHWTFLLTMVAMTTMATLIVVVPLQRGALAAGALRGPQRLLAPALAAALLAGIAGALYLRNGTPDLATAPRTAAAHPGMVVPGSTAAAGTMEEAARRLAERLSANPDDTEGWRLLAKSYETLGRADEARAAWKHVPDAAPAADVAPARVPATVPDSSEIAALAVQARARPRDVDAWVTLAQAYRVARRFAEANDAYAHAIGAGSVSADVWADYADAQAAANGGRLAGTPETAIGKALAQDPGHVKALWLKGSAETERRDYRAALQTWQSLARRLPPGSPDARAITGNIAEARAMLAGAGGRRESGAHVRGTIELDASLRDLVVRGDTLFVVARSGTGGPPYAVLRTPADRFPFEFDLDDTLAMMPGHDLSSAESVIVEARVSRSGNALPQPGDLRVTSTPLRVADRPRVRLKIREVVP
ncbi:MAG: tetratricopeptide repeat protein [Steroidobacteraceae bacterium]